MASGWVMAAQNQPSRRSTVGEQRGERQQDEERQIRDGERRAAGTPGDPPRRVQDGEGAAGGDEARRPVRDATGGRLVPPGRPRSAAVASTPVTGRYPLAVETPSVCSTLATTPVWRSRTTC